nr:N-acetylmuramoyl-L-alanine amidase [Chloroflexaceae bacterium]
MSSQRTLLLSLLVAIGLVFGVGFSFWGGTAGQFAEAEANARPALPAGITAAPTRTAPPATPTSATPQATATIPAPAATAPPTGPTAVPTPTPRPAGTPWRVGLQVGHWKVNELPDELARLRTSTGASWNGISEAELNMSIVTRVKPLLEAQGVVVDMLPATVPPRYDADAFIAIHADGVVGATKRGWKIATPWRASQASRQLLRAISDNYPATGIPEDVGGVTVNMRGYYAFSYRRFVHAIAPTTPAVILEMGFMTSAADREVMFGQPDLVAQAIANGIMAYLQQRNPNDGAALLPPEFPVLRAKPEGAILRAAPNDNARVLATITP